jgi:hypothetical protein
MTRGATAASRKRTTFPSELPGPSLLWERGAL